MRSFISGRCDGRMGYFNFLSSSAGVHRWQWRRRGQFHRGGPSGRQGDEWHTTDEYAARGVFPVPVEWEQ